MTSFSELFSNRWLWAAVLAMLLAQVVKVLLILVLTRRWEPGRLFETGGMPSSHTAFVVALTTGVGLTQGLGSPLFAACAVFSMIVMHDATGVRRSSGLQARMINDLIDELRAVVRENFAPEPLRVLLGHTYLEVVVGLLLGLVAGFIAFRWIP